MSKESLNTINYFELPSDETNQLKDFYTSLFHWTFKESKDTPDYWYPENAGMEVAILKRRSNRQNTTFYIEVGSIDECISKSKESGAHVIVDKHEISEGFYALLEDPQGNVIGIWEGKS